MYYNHVGLIVVDKPSISCVCVRNPRLGASEGKLEIVKIWIDL